MHCRLISIAHDDVIKWKHFPRYWPFVRGIHRSTVNSPQKGQWGRALMFSLIFAWMNGLVNNREAGALRRHRVHYDVTVMCYLIYLDNIFDKNKLSWNIVNWTVGNKLQWNFNWNLNILFFNQLHVTVVWKMASILFQFNDLRRPPLLPLWH